MTDVVSFLFGQGELIYFKVTGNSAQFCIHSFIKTFMSLFEFWRLVSSAKIIYFSFSEVEYR